VRSSLDADVRSLALMILRAYASLERSTGF
jgi:hypothetical protein